MRKPSAPSFLNPKPVSDDARAIIDSFSEARSRRASWEGLWRDCYAYALPHSDAFSQGQVSAPTQIFDGTALDAVDQLASSLLANLFFRA